MPQTGDVAIFWDFESLPPSSDLTGNETVENIRSLAQAFGSIISFKAYLEVSLVPSHLRSELQSSGVSLTDCPRRMNDSVADKMLITDMMTFAMDHKPPVSIVMISTVEAYAYPLSILRFRNYQVIVISPSGSHKSLAAQASVHLDWNPKAAHELSPQLEPINTPDHPVFTHSRRSVTSSTNRGTTPSGRASLRKDEEDEEVLVYDSHADALKDSHQNLPRANGIVNEHAPSTYALTGIPWRQTSSRATSKPYSPPLSFQSAKSPPPTPSPPARTFITNGETLFESSSHPNLPQGFPFNETEPTTTSSAQPSTSAPKEKPTSEPSAASSSRLPTEPPPARVPTPPKDLEDLVSKNPSLPDVKSTDTLSLPPTSQQVARDLPAKSIFSPSITPVVSPYVPAPVIHKPPPSKSTAPPTPPQTSKVNQSVKPKASSSQLPPLAHFLPLITALKARSQYRGQAIPRTDVGQDMSKHRSSYTQAGVSSFSAFILLAREADIVDVGGSGNDQWVRLRSPWRDT